MNFRPLVLFALSLIVGIVFATYIFASQNLKIVFMIFFSLLIICNIILMFIFKKKFLCIVFVCLMLFTIPIVQLYSKTKDYNKIQQYAKETIVVSGRISSNYKITASGSLNIVLDDVVLIGPNYKTKIDGKFSIYTNPNNFDLDLLNIGTYVAALGDFDVYDIENIKDYTLFNLSKNIVASGYVYYSNIEIKNESKLFLDEKFRSLVYEKLESFDLEYKDIGYAMLFGDSSTIDEDVLLSFRTTGIAHLLAVSGLHVSILAMIISFVLKRLKCNNYANLAIMAIILSVYSYLCNFSVSVVRASLMMIFFLYLKARGKCYDRLSSMSLAMCVILLANPLNLFNASFILSFIAVYSIIILAKTLEEVFEKCLHKKMAGSLALVFAVQVGLIFIQLYFFKRYTPLSIVCNLISIPVATIAFVLLIVGTVIASVIPFMSFICLGYDYLMSLIVKFNYTLSKTALIFSVNNLNFWIVILGIFVIFLISNFVFIKKRYKFVGLLLCLLTCFLIL